MLRIIIAGVLAFHGIGQAMGIIPALQLSIVQNSQADWLQRWSSQSWLITPLLGDGAARVSSLLLFGIPLVGFLAASLAVMGWGIPHHLWRTLALGSAGVSMVALLLHWNAFIMLFPHKIGSIVLNVALFVLLLVVHWPADADL